MESSAKLLMAFSQYSLCLMNCYLIIHIERSIGKRANHEQETKFFERFKTVKLKKIFCIKIF